MLCMSGYYDHRIPACGGLRCVMDYILYTIKYTLIHSYTRTLIHSYTHTLIHSYSHTLIHPPLDGYFPSICAFMLQTVMDQEESVAIESCEFWRSLLETDDTKNAILPYLQRLVECIISRLYLTQEQMEQDRIDEEEECSGVL